MYMNGIPESIFLLVAPAFDPARHGLPTTQVDLAATFTGIAGVPYDPKVQRKVDCAASYRAAA